MGNLQKKRRTAGKTALAYRGKSGQNTGNDFLALRLGVVLYLLNKQGSSRESQPYWGCGPIPLFAEASKTSEEKRMFNHFQSGQLQSASRSFNPFSLTLQSLLFFLLKKQGTRKKSKDFPLCRTLKILGEEWKTHTKKQGKSKNEKARKTNKARIGGSGFLGWHVCRTKSARNIFFHSAQHAGTPTCYLRCLLQGGGPKRRSRVESHDHAHKP